MKSWWWESGAVVGTAPGMPTSHSGVWSVSPGLWVGNPASWSWWPWKAANHGSNTRVFETHMGDMSGILVFWRWAWFCLDCCGHLVNFPTDRRSLSLSDQVKVNRLKVEKIIRTEKKSIKQIKIVEKKIDETQIRFSALGKRSIEEINP